MTAAPDFFIVGAPKSGTTSLYRYLEQHPDIFMSDFKEPNFYGQQTAALTQTPCFDSRDKYLALFTGASPEQLCGEASTLYLRAPEAPGLIHADAPRAKIIMLLREPGERAFSHYQMRYRAGDIATPFPDCFALAPGDDERDYRVFQHLVLEPGFYGQQVPRYIEQFGRENVLTLTAEDFFAEPAAMARQVFAFLGVDDNVTLSTEERFNNYREPRGKLGLALIQRKRHLKFLKRLVPPRLKWWISSNLFSKPGAKPTLPGSARTQLTAIYRDDVVRLRKCLDRPHLWQEVYK